MGQKIIQWNCRGLKANLNELLLLLTQESPTIICLQETFLKQEDNINIKNYQIFSHIHDTGHRASGGVSVLIRNDIPHSKLNIQTNIQAVAIKATLHITVNICSIYIPPNDDINESDLKKLIDQLPTPFILLGDFNSHNTLWGCKNTTKKGKTMEKFINENDLCLLNGGVQTYMNPFNGSGSAIDLAICDPTVYMDFIWRVYDDTCGSDYFPILLENIEPSGESKPNNWKLGKANWQMFKEKCQEKLTHMETDSDPVEYFTDRLIKIAEDCIPKNSTPNKRNRPWFNNECRKAIRLRRAALKKFQKEPISSNLIKYKENRASARRVIKAAKKECWQKYVGKLNSSSKPKAVWEMIGKIAGKHQSKPIKHLSKNNCKITTKKEISNQLAETFSQNSSSHGGKQEFLTIKRNAEKHKLNFK